jgi:hypothetical protein
MGFIPGQSGYDGKKGVIWSDRRSEFCGNWSWFSGQLPTFRARLSIFLNEIITITYPPIGQTQTRPENWACIFRALLSSPHPVLPCQESPNPLGIPRIRRAEAEENKCADEADTDTPTIVPGMAKPRHLGRAESWNSPAKNINSHEQPG